MAEFVKVGASEAYELKVLVFGIRNEKRAWVWESAIRLAVSRRCSIVGKLSGIAQKCARHITKPAPHRVWRAT
jgi:hypothetical protein